MIYNPSNEFELQKAKKRFDWLISKNKKFELKEVRKRRTFKQNRYLHLILGLFSVELGYTLEESKIIYKRLNPEIYKYTKNDQVFLRSSAKLNTKELSITIDKFRNYSNSELGIYLPEANETAYLNELEEELKKYNNQIYL